MGDKMGEMPKWIQRWVKRVKKGFPECAVRCSFSSKHFGYLLEVYYPKRQAWSATGNWRIWGILLNPTESPTVWQNRRWFREKFDYTLQQEIKRFGLRGNNE